MSVFMETLPDPSLVSVLGCDLETSGYGATNPDKAGLDPFEGLLLSIAFSDGKDTWILTKDFEKAAILLVDPLVIKIFHNAKFDMKWIKHKLGIEVKSFYDSMLAENELVSGKDEPTSLQAIIAKRQGVFISKDTREEFREHPGFHIIPPTEEQLGYIEKDVLYLPEIRQQQLQELKQDDLLPVYHLEHGCVPVVVKMELGGICFDIDLWQQQKLEMEELIVYYDQAFRELVGEDFVAEVDRVSKGTPYVAEIPIAELNFNSVQQLRSVFAQRFNLVLNSTRKEILEDVVEGRLILDSTIDPAIKLACEYLLGIRAWTKRLGYDYPKYINPITGKIHSDYWQSGAETGRFSSSNPNMQNVPKPAKKGPNMRNLFIADTPDHRIVRIDYAQNEMRILGHMSGDKHLIQACNKEDVYAEAGSILYGYSVVKGMPERFTAKTFVLAVGFGAGAEKLSRTSGKPVHECADLRNKIRTRFPIMARYADKMNRQRQIYGYVTTASGRRRYFARGGNFSQSINTPIQGTAADMFKLAMIKVDKWLTNQINYGKIDHKSRIWNIVHDEIEIHCHKDDVEFVIEHVCRLMEEAGNELCPSVKHIAEAEYGYRWDK